MSTRPAAKKVHPFWLQNKSTLPELSSIASMLKIDLKWGVKPVEEPYIIIEMDNESDALKLMSHTMLVRSCYELWGEGNTESELHSSVQSCPSELINPHIAVDKSFKIRVETFNKKLKNNERLKKIESFSYIPFEGPVNLTNADTHLQLIEYYGLHPNIIPENPLKLFFGRWIMDGQRELINRFSVKNRCYIGNTSMDAQLSFIMCNFAQIQPGSIVVDPFVGTGSVLVAAAEKGAHVWGGDIDFLTLHAKTRPSRYLQKERNEKESIFGNLEQYNLSHKYLDVVVMDSARPFWRNIPFIDAIVTDPPYGIRESTERVGTHKEQNKGSLSPSPSLDSDNISNETDLNMPSQQNSPEDLLHFPTKINYCLSDIFRDLLEFAARHLRIGGRLVFWLPIFREDYTPDQVPSHPCLKQIDNCEQALTMHSSRRLITLQKNRHLKEGEHATAKVVDVMAEFRDKFFQASLISKEERMKKKNFLITDKRGQGLGYRLNEPTKKERKKLKKSETQLL
ncbi:unnamed protein product, partial [Meganyctiphanes norvegica]